MRLLIDEMFAAAIADSLRDSGIDAIAIQEVPELRGLPDDQVFVHAQLEQRCVVTENVADVRSPGLRLIGASAGVAVHPAGSCSFTVPVLGCRA